MLLSGDSPFAEVYQSLLSDENDAQSGGAEAYIQQLDAETSAEIAGARGSDFDGTQTQTGAKVAWSGSWQVGPAATSTSPQETIGVVQTDASDASVEAENWADTAVQQVLGSTSSPETGQAEAEKTSADSGDQNDSSTIPTAELARGPPVDSQVFSVVIAAASIQINDLALFSSSSSSEGEAFGVQSPVISEVLELSLARAPPVANTLTYESLAPLVQAAVQLWTAAGISPELADRLANLQVEITDLAGGDLGHAHQNTITLDATAAGYGWFVDPSPGDNVEFSLPLSQSQIAASADSPARGRLDLLTVLVHEIGHVLGLGHDADQAVMHESLTPGRRALLEGNAGSLVAGLDQFGAGSQETLNVVVADRIELAIQAFKDAKDLLVTIEAAANQDLPVLGLSLNALLLMAGFDLFDEFSSALAPVTSAVSALGTIDQRVAELEELLEDAFGFTQGDSSFDNPEIELVYDLVNDTLDMVFAFELADTDVLTVEELDLVWQLGVAFTLSLAFDELVAGTIDGLGLTLGLTGSVAINSTALNLQGNGSAELNLLEMLGGSVPSVTFEAVVTGDLDLGGAIQLSGTFGFEHRAGNLKLANGTALNGAYYTVISGADIDGFFGSGPFVSSVATPNAVGLSISDVDFSLLLLTNGGFDYTALITSGGSASFVGIPDLVIGASDIEVVFNSTSDTAHASVVLDFNAAGVVAGIAVDPIVGPALDLEGEDGAVFEVSADFGLDAFGFVTVAGSLTIVKKTNVDIADGNLTFKGDVLQLSLAGAAFVGSGGSLGEDPITNAATVVTTDAVGFSMPGVALDLVIVRNIAVPANKYTGLELEVTDAGLIGIDELGLTVSGTVQVNKGPQGVRLDWSALTVGGSKLTGVTLTMDDTIDMAIRDGSVALDAFGFVQLAGTFNLVKQTDITINDSNLLEFQADVLSLSITASGFAGVGGALLADDVSLTTVTPGTLGFNVPSVSLDLLLVQNRETPANKYTGLQVGLTHAGLLGMPGDFALTVSGQVQINNGPSGSRLDWSAITGDGNVLTDVTLGMDETISMAISDGSFALNMFGLAQLAGTGFTLVKQTDVLIKDGKLTEFHADVLSLSMTAAGFAGIGGSLSAPNLSTATVDVGDDALGFNVPSAALDLVMVKDRAKPANRYTGLQLAVTNAGLVGVDELGLTISGELKVNTGPAAGGRLDWTQVTGGANEIPAVTLAMNEKVEFAINDGSIALDAFGYVQLAGSFDLVKQTNVTIDDTHITPFQADVLSLSIKNASGFAGTGGELSVEGDSLATVVPGADAVGLSISGSAVDLVLVKALTTPVKNYMGLQVSVSNASLEGIDGIGMKVSGAVQVNKGPATGPRLDWSQVTGSANEVKTVALTMNEKQQFSATGTVGLDVFGFVQVFGEFALTKYSTTVTLAGKTSPTAVDVLTIGMNDVNVFVGVGPYFDSSGNLHTSSADAIGLLLKKTSLALALFTPTGGTGSGSFHTLRAYATDMTLLGLVSDSSETFVLDASGYRIEINGGSTGAINFAAGVGATHEAFKVETGPGKTETFTYSTALQRVAVDNGTLIIGDYVYVSGGFSFTRQTGVSVKLSTGVDQTVDMLAFGAGNLDIFVGSGPYFQKGTEDRDPNAVGLALENVNFGLLLMKSTSTPGTKYTAMMATADRVGLVGLDSLTLSAGMVTVEYNSSNKPGDTVVNFKAKPYLLDTGNGQLAINFSSKVLRASIEDAQLQIESNVFISGGLAFQKGPTRTVNLTSGTAQVSAIEVGAQDVSMFFGVNGPYWNDVNGDGIVQDAEKNLAAVGFAITNADLAMTLLRPDGAGTKYLGLHATADQAGFVGITGFELGASMVAVDLNIAMGAGVDSNTPVVDFAAAFPNDERQALFNIFDSNLDKSISADELTTALGTGHGATMPLTTTQQLVNLLNVGGAPPDALVLTDVLARLDPAFKTAARLAAINAIDANGDKDGKFDPIGYEIKTGAGYFYLAADSRQIHASADNVILNVAGFLYVRGSVALDIGSRETVTIDTGIPASLGESLSSVVTLANTALDKLEGALDTLKLTIEQQIDLALQKARDGIDGLIAGVIDSIVDKLRTELAAIGGSLADLTQSQLSGAIAAVSTEVKTLVTNTLTTLLGTLSVSQLIEDVLDPIMAPVTGALPEMLSAPVSSLLDSLLDPIREKVNAQFGGTIAEAVTGAIDRITASVSVAVEAAIQEAAASALGTFDAAVIAGRARIEAEIKKVLDPQFNRVHTELDKLLARATAQLEPIFDRLHAITDIQVGENFATLTKVEVEVTAIGISNASAFVGLPPESGFKDNLPLSGQVDAAFGLYIDGLSLALGIFKPIVGKQLPTFTAIRIHADEAGLRDGGSNILDLTAKGIDVELNLGGPIAQGAGALFANATIDFVASFAAAGLVPAGYAVQTSTTGTPVYLDFADGELIRASVEHAELHISEFVHITGSLAFEKGNIATVDVIGGLTGPLVDTVLDELDVSVGNVVPGVPWTGAKTAELAFITIGGSNLHAFVGIDGPYWTDANLNDVVEDSELNDNAKGLWIERFDFGMAIMKPTNVLDFVKYFALKATANDISMVGIEGVSIVADDLLVEVNQSSPGLYGLPLFPVVDFASTYESERQALFTLLAGTNKEISPDELTIAFGTGHGVTGALTTVDQLMALLDIGGAPPLGIGPDGILSMKEVTDRLTTPFKNAIAFGQSLTNLQRIEAFDADGDDKFDPAGYEVNTGGTPVYLDMDSSLIRAQGFLELNLFDMVYLTGSVAFELGKTQEVTLSDSTALAPSVKTVSTMTIGAANVTAFIGSGGPYWKDLDKNQEVTSNGDANGNGRIDANESDELNDASVGFEVTDLDVGILIMASTNVSDLGVYVAAKLNVNSFGLVGIDGLTATGSFDVALNVGVGLSGISPSLAVVDFTSSFSEATALFELMDSSHDGIVDQVEQGVALEAAYVGDAITTVAQLVALLNSSNGPPDDYLTMLEVRAKLKDSFETSRQDAIDGLDADANGRLNTGFEVNTGNPAAPVVLDFEDVLISIQLGGEIELANVFRMYGVFIFEVDSSGLKAFVAAGLEVGPDTGSDSKIFNMNALGALIINGEGIAADLNISISIGGALSDFIELDATARLVFNTTGKDQSVTIPARYVNFLISESSIPSSDVFDSEQVKGLALKFDSRLKSNLDGSATFTISGKASDDVAAGFYLLATFHADLNILSTFKVVADFRLLLTADKFDLGFSGTLALGGFNSYNITGGAVIGANGFAAHGALTVAINLGNGAVTVGGAAELKVNTSTSTAVLVNGNTIAANTYKVAVKATIGFFGIVSATADVSIGVENGIFEIAINKLNIDLYILNVDISGYIRSNGQFKLTGSVGLNLQEGGFGITGAIGLTISNTGFSGYGNVGIVLFGQSFNVASAQLSVTFGSNPSVFIRVDGPLGVYLELTIIDGDFSFDGGLGFLDDIIGAIGDVAEAVGAAVVEAALIVGAAFVDLGNAILDLGAAIGDALIGFVEDVGKLIDDIAGAIAEFFSSSRTIVIKKPPTAQYSYSWVEAGGVLTINMKGGTLTGVESPLSFAVVGNKLIVDGPNQTERVVVAERQRQTRSWNWGRARWNDWSNDGGAYGQVYADIEYSNMKGFEGVTKIIVHGTEGNDTIVMDTASISIPADVYGYGGDDSILTGRGDDYVDGGTGNDSIFTFGGADKLHGGEGNDKLSGGTGNDDLYGEGGNDLLNESMDRGNNSRLLLSETNLLDGGDGDDQILGSPGKDRIIGGSGNDKITGLNNEDTYVFNNSYGTDTFADYFGKAYLDFSAVTSNLAVSISAVGLSVDAGGAHVFAVDAFISIQQHVSTTGVSTYQDFEIAQIKTGSGNDTVAFTALPMYRMDIVDAGGLDVYNFELIALDVAQAVARVDIVDNGGTADQINLVVDSTGFDTYLHLQPALNPQAVLLNKFNLTFNFDNQIEVLNFTDNATKTTITTSAASGLKTLLIRDDVTITSAPGGIIELIARGDFILEAGALVQTLGAVVIRADDDDVDSTGATINLFGTVKADTVAVYGNDDNDTVNITNVFTGAETTVNGGAGSDTFNVGTLAPAAGGNLDRIGALLTIYGEAGFDTLNADDTGDVNANSGTLTATTLTGLDMVGGIAYGTVETLNIGLGAAGDVFTVESTHTGVTNLNTNNGDDVVNVRTIAGVTNVNGGIGSESFNVGSNAQGVQGDATARGNNAGGTVDGIGALLTLSGNDPTSGSDWLIVDDTGDTNVNAGTLTSTTITGLDMVGSISYATIEHLIISLGSGGDTFTINSTHGAATGTNEDTTVNSGSGADTVNINDVTDLLYVNGQADDDTINVYGTGTGSVSTLNGDAGNDVINVRAMNGTVNVNGGDDSDTINVGSDTPTLPSVPTNQQSTTDAVNGLLAVNGGNGSDTMNVDDSDPAVANKSGTLTSNTLRGLDLEKGVDYSLLETLNIWLATGDNTFTITSTHAGATTLSTALGNDTVNVDGASGTLTINAEAGNDIVNVRATGLGSQTRINGQGGNDTVNVGSNAAGTPSNASNNSGGTVDNIGGLLTINGDGETDVVNVDDTGDANANSGTLTATTLTGLDMAGSMAYGTIETLNIGLGAAGDVFTIQGTHTVATHLNANHGDDVVNVQTIAGLTNVNGGLGSDTFNVGSNAQGAQGSAQARGNNAGGTVDGIAAVLTLNGNDPASGSDSDRLIVDDTGDANANSGALSATAITGLDMAGSIAYATVEHLLISLGSGGNTFTIDSTHGAATGTNEDTTVNSGSGADTVHVNDAADLLQVNGQAGGDTINVYGTGAASVSALNGDAGNDVINVRAMNGTVNANGGADDDTINAGSSAPALPAAPTSPQGTTDAIDGLLTVNGGTGSDTLNVDDSAPALASKSGTLTGTSLRGLALEQGIDYSLLETLNIWLAAGDNRFTITGTHAGSTTLSTALGDDTVDVDGASGVLTINAEAGNDIVNVRASGLGSQTRINGQGGNDTVNLSDHSPLLPDAYPTVLAPPAADTEGTIDAIDGLIAIDGGADVDVINLDDSRNAASKAGTLAAGYLRGLEMEAGVNYVNAEDFNLWLGTGTDGLYIDSTHAGTTDVFMGDGNAAVNQRDDTAAIRSIGGVTTIHGQRGNDFFYVNVQPAAANDADFFTKFKAAAANDSLFNALFTRTHANGLGAVLNLHGDGNSDAYTVNLAGQGQALVNVRDNGAPDNGVDTLVINGADVVGGLANQPNDTFLLRRDFVALFNDSDANGSLDKVERVNYDENINARLIVNGLGGDDKFVADDTSTVTTLDGGDGDDTFQIGQIFGTLRDVAASVAAGDVFGTTPVIIGVIRDPVTNAVIFDPTSFDPVAQTLSPAKIDQINAAIQYQRDHGGLALGGVAYVSQGVSHATTAYGGNGQDTFNVYRNTGTLRLEGEAGNDTFTVRAFVAIDLSVQAKTEVNGGDGADTINYAVNAPVNIDGGAGFDKVVVLGTPFNDSFVVSSEGIFGAGLNVKFTNVESAELDTLEGNDTIFVLSTSEDIVTTVIGGLGNDTVNVSGDVTQPIVSNDLLGRSGLITQGLTSADADYHLVGAGGVAVNVLSAGGDHLIKIAPTGEPLLVSEAGLLAQYSISLVNSSLLGGIPVYLTVSAGVVSSTDRSLGGAGVLVSVNGGAFTSAVVLTFDATSKDTVFMIRVKAIDDSAAEGPRMALISHGINSANAAFNELALVDIFVNILDNDQPGLDIRHLAADGTVYGSHNTQVLEGANGFGDIYSVVLTAAPGANETVTVTLVADAQLSARSSVGNATFLTFNAANWFTPQQVTVTALHDGLDGTSISRISHVVTSTGGAYTALPATASSRLSVTVYDDDTPAVIVQQSGGTTIVVEGGATDGYRVRLTQAPDSNVTLTLRTDMQTLLSGAGLVAVNLTGALGYFEYAHTFTIGNWAAWADITVSANPNAPGTDSKLKSFAPQDQNLDQIRGPLIIEGGIGAGVLRAFAVPVMLPGETNGISAALLDQPSSAALQESNDIDILNVFHTDNSDADTGRLFYRTVDEAGIAVANIGLALTGFEMGRDVRVEQGTAGAPLTVHYGGGITYNGFEIVEVLLGKGNETLTIDDTGDRDEKDSNVGVDHAAITAIHGGGGNDTITVNNRGEGPLVVYGDTSEDGARYSNNQPAASANGTSFGNPGNDTIDASGMLAQGDAFAGVVIFGGAGNDLITGSQDNDHLAGGSGSDTLRGQSGNDHLYGDSSFNVDLRLFAQDQIAPFDASKPLELANINAMFTVVVTAVAGGDTVYGDAGNDVAFGDHGIIDQLAGTRRIMSTGAVTQITTTEPENGVADTLYGGADSDILLGGNGGDTIDAGDGNNIVLGDLGYIDYVALHPNLSDIDLIASTETTSLGGADSITAGSGNDIIIGGRWGDTIHAGEGDNLVFGDSARITAADSGAAQIAGQPITLGLVASIATDDGGADVISTGGGNDIVLGGAGADTMTLGAGNDIALGDNGELVYDTASGATLSVIRTITHSHGGADTIQGNAGDDIVMGGFGADVIDGGSDRDLLLGDQGVLDKAGNNSNPRYRALQGTLLYEANGETLFSAATFSGPNVPAWSNWTITVGDGLDGFFGNDYIAGGAGDDTIFGQSGDDVLQGDGSIAGRLANPANSVGASRSAGGLFVIPSFESESDGDDYIEGNSGNDVIFGNLGQDDIVGGSSSLFGLTRVAQRLDGSDLVFGGAGTETLRNETGNVLDAGDSAHARDADAIAGDNANIYRVVNASGGLLSFNYDSTAFNGLQGASGYETNLKLVPRAVALLDYTPGGPDLVPASATADMGAGDELHGESGDDFIYGMTGNDVLFGEGQDDDLIGGWGNDWISGGTGQDGVLGDDGRIFTSRNGTAEALYGIVPVAASRISTPGNGLVADINVAGQLKKSVDLAPYNVDPAGQPVGFIPKYADDIIYGGLGSDFLHGGSGDDAISGAEAMATFYAAPVNQGNVLRFNTLTGEFADYNEKSPLKQIPNFLLNFNATEGEALGGGIFSDGDDKIFGDLGNDWLVGGTGRDHMYGGWGNDLLNADDDLGTNGGLNNTPDTHTSYEDIAFGGAGRDRLIGNTAGDRLIDWVGEFNSYIVPFNPFGAGTVSRAISPGIPEFLYALSKADGADQTLGGNGTRNGEPFGELGLVNQGDVAFGVQTGKPDDPQPGSGGGKK